MFCQNCGKDIPDGVKFCPGCGTPVTMGANVKMHAEQAADSAREYAKGVGSSFNSAINEVENDFRGSHYNGGVRLKTDRNLIVYILLTLLTCGIYGYYFIYTMARDINVACEDDGEKTSGLLMYIVLSIVTCGFYNYYWLYKITNRMAANANRYGITIVETGTAVLVWKIFGMFLCCIGTFVGDNIVITNANKICNAYNRYHNL